MNHRRGKTPKAPPRERHPRDGTHRPIADYYDAENERHPILKQDVPFFLGLLPRKRQRILELCVGSGRAAIPIAQARHRVVGVDLSADMVELAKRKRDAVGLTAEQLALHVGDATRFRATQKFDWVCIFFNTLLNFNSLEALDAVLRNARRHIRPRSGRFFFDIFQPDLTLLAIPHARRRAPEVFFVPELRRTVYHEIEIRQNPSRQIQHVTFHYHWYDDAGRPKHQRVKFDVTYLFPRELRMLLERNGFELETLWGDYDGSELNDDSPRMIGVARVKSAPRRRG